MTAQQVLDEQAVLQEAQDQRVLLEDAGGVEAALVAHGPAQHVEAVHEVGGPEVVQPGLRFGLRHEAGRVECELRPRLPHEVEDRPGVVGVLRLGHVRYPDRRWSDTHTVATGSTSTWGCSGVSAGRNQRNQMRPLRCPAVDTQLGWAGRWDETTMIHDPSCS